jgi:tRNA(adenine34) deaminase
MVLEGATLYTTVEPCVLCGYVVRTVRLSRVVYRAPAGRLGGCRSAYALVTDASLTEWGPPSAIAQVLSDECAALLERHGVARRRP